MELLRTFRGESEKNIQAFKIKWDPGIKEKTPKKPARLSAPLFQNFHDF